MPNIISIGQVLKRADKCPIRICDILSNKRYRAQKVLGPFRESYLLKRASPEQLVPGNILNLEDGRRVELLGRGEPGYWHGTYPNDFLEMTEQQLQELELDETRCLK